MHVLLIHQAFAALDEPGGTRHHELAQYLAIQGHQVTVIASPVSYLTGKKNVSMQKENLSSESINIIRCYTYSALHKSFVHRVFSFLSFMISSFLAGLRVSGVDLVWGTSPPIFQGITAWTVARLKRVPLLFEVRDLWPAFAIQVGVLHNSLLIWLSEWLERFLYRHADQVMVNSPGFIPHVTSKGARQVTLIPNGADVSMFNPGDDGADFRDAHDLDGKFVVLYAGAHGLSNDLGVVLQAAEQLQDLPEVAIVFLGDGKEKPSLQARAEKMGLTNVYFLPPVPKTAIPKALAAADACLGILKPIPLYGTVYPNKIFDYLAAGRAVILAMEGVIREVVEKAEAGISVPPGDPKALANAVRTLVADREMCRQMGLAGRVYIEDNFDRTTLATQLEKLMIDLV